MAEVILFVLLPILLFYLMEAFEHNAFMEVRIKAQIFNGLLFELGAWFLFFLFGRAGWALAAEAILALLFGLVNHYVLLFRSTPFVPWDIFSIQTAASVVGNYSFFPTRRVVILSVLLAGIAVGVCFMRLKLKGRLMIRMIPLLLVGMVSGGFVHLLQDVNFQTRNYLYPFLFTPAYMTKVNGMAVTFAMNLAYLAVEKPAGYKEAEAGELLRSYEEDNTSHKTDGEDSGEEVQKDSVSQQLPNVIVVMDEAFSDLSLLGDFAVSEDPIPFVHRFMEGQENTISGYLNVSVCGGNTANSEFEFLTGNTMAFLPTGSIPYQQYVKNEIPSLASHLESLGYETYAQHPYYRSGWDRDSVYPLLGFSNLTFLEDYGMSNYIRNYVSDASSFEKIIETYQKKEEGKPAFIFNVTMQNHGGYTEEYDNFHPDITTEFHSAALEQYLSLLKRTDSALEQLIDYFALEQEPTVIVFFGDHQPNDAVAAPILAANGMSVKNLTDEELALRYQVPYVIWANFDIQEETGADSSVNYLAANVLRAAGIPMGGYQKFLLKLQEQYPILSAIRRVENPTGETSDLLSQYQKLQYYQMFHSQ